MSLSFSVAAGGVRRYIRYVILFCVAVVMVGTMVLTTYTASADSATTMPLRYNAEARAKVKAYYKVLEYCYRQTDTVDDLLIYHALSGKWGTDNKDGDGSVGTNFKDDFLAGIRGLENDKEYDCSDGNLIKEAFDYFATVSGSKPWNQWTLDEKKDLFCGPATDDGLNESGWFKAAYDLTGTNDYARQDCRGNVDFVVANQGDFDKIKNYAFVNTSVTDSLYDDGGDISKGINYLRTYLMNNIFNNDASIDLDGNASYTDDELFYVYRGLIAKQCSAGKAPSDYDPRNDYDDYIAAIKFVLDGNALRIQKQWWPKEENSATLLFRQYLSCKDVIENGVDDPAKKYVSAAMNTLVNYYKDDCLNKYEDFYGKQSDYKNRLTEPNESDYDDKTDYDRAKAIYDAYIAWFDILPLPETLRGDSSFCIDNGIYIEQEWPNNPIFECRLDEYINGLLSTNPDSNSPEWTGYTIPGLMNDDDDTDSTRTNPCYQSAGALGWAICPIMSSLGNTLTSIYEDMVEPFLAVNPRLLGAEAKSVVDKVSTFANIAIIIFLLVIIFSQLTGVGIDNYGIKKSLPKLIVTVILVNLSFVICQVAVDLSNIVGSGANSMLSGVDVSVKTCTMNGSSTGNGVMLNVPGGQQCVPADISSGSEAGMFRALVDIASVGLAGVGVIGVGSIILGVASSGWLAGLIIPVLLLLITAVIAVLFFFVLLGVRQAGVVILAVLSPLALVCYMLPNTKRYFDKWKKAFTGLLVLYPICGLLIGGGQLAAKILISASQDYVTYFAGCLIMVVPFFFIPSLLKGSFAAMGNIGAKISGFGKSLGSRGRGRVEGAFKNSDRYKNRVDFNQKRAAERRAERTIDRLGRRTNLNRRQQARMAAANSVLDESAKRRRENEQKSDLSYRGAMDAKIGLESEESRRNLSDYNNTGFVHAKQVQGMVSHDENFQDALQYNNRKFVKAQRTKSQNARMERWAEADVEVLPLNQGLAISRAKSRRDAQELKAYQDQFAGFDQTQLKSEVANAGTWLSQQGGSQRMSALISAMSSRGMEEDIFRMLKTPGVNVSGDDAIMGALANSSNYLLKAYGKKGSGKDFSTFETDGTLQAYIKDNDIKGADKDSLVEINAMGSNMVERKVAMDGALSAQVPKVREQMNNIIKNQISSMSSLSDLSSFGLTAGGFGSMSDDTAQAMLSSVTDYISSRNPRLTPAQAHAHAQAALQSAFANQIRDARANDQISSKVSSGVSSVFGI